MVWTGVVACVVVAAVLATFVAFRRRRARAAQTVSPTTVDAVPARGGSLRADAVAALLSPGTRLPDGWQGRAEAAVSERLPDPPVEVGPAVWNRAASLLGVPDLRVVDPSDLDDPAAAVDPVGFSSTVGTSGPSSRRGSLRTRRRMANLPAASQEPEQGVEDAAPVSRPWSARGAPVDADWRELDLPEPVPDDFRFDEPVDVHDPVAVEAAVAAFTGPSGPSGTSRRRGSLRARRRMANLPDLAAEPLFDEPVPVSRPWSARGGYVDVDWRALDLPEPIPDEFVR